MRKRTRRLGAIIAVLGLVCAMGASAWAISIQDPSGNPFSVPGDAMGNPEFFNITATGFQPFEAAYAQICDGTPPTSTGYSVNDHCDLETSNAPAHADTSGNAFFDATDAQGTRLNVFKGPSPENRFNCLSPDDPSPHNGLLDWRDCQVRISGGTPGDTTEQVFFTMILPNDPNDFTTTTSTTTSTTSTTSTTTTSTTTSTTTTSTTTIPVLHPTCGMGAGITRPIGPPINTGMLKISHGLKAAASTSNTNLKFTGTLDNCANFPMSPKTGTPITAGSMKLSIAEPPGASCTNVVSGAPVKVALTVKWSALKAGKPVNAAADKVKALATFVRNGAGAPLDLVATTGPITSVKSLFIGQHLQLEFVLDETQAQLDAACASAMGISLLHFTGVSGPSTITVLP
jgi:hypothetical protein